MNFTPAPTQSDVQTALRAFLLYVLPAGVEVVQGQDNRVPEPAVANFVVMTLLRQERLATNVDTYADTAFTGSIAGTLMTVTAMERGAIAATNILFGTGVSSNSSIVAQVSGTPGGVGTYTIAPSQTVASGLLACGNEILTQQAEMTFQLDVHGPNSASNAQTISTLFRDEVASEFWISNGYLTSAPLHADDPKQIPFLNDQQQIETRWVIDCCLQANQALTVPMQFAEQLQATIIPVN